MVADEVRNLAQRAAEAAKNTAGLIEGSVKQRKEGRSWSSEANKALTTVIAERRQGRPPWSAEIAAASSEQAQGIEQINTAVPRWTRSRSRTRPTPRSPPAAAEELNAQAEQMLAVVNDLVAVVGGTQDGGKSGGTPSKRKKSAAGKGKQASALRQPVMSKRSAKAEAVIPLEDDETAGFANF